MKRQSAGPGWVGTMAWLNGIGGFLSRCAALALALTLATAVSGPGIAVAQDDDDAEVDEPLGIFTVAIGEADLPPALPGGPGLIGLWNVSFNEDGTYTVARQDVGVVATGTYEVDGDTLTIADEGGLLSCGNDPEADAAEATYAWEVDGGELTLTPIEETCAARRIILTTRSLGGYQPCDTVPLGGVRDEDQGEDPDSAEDDEKAGSSLNDIFGSGETGDADEDVDEDGGGGQAPAEVEAAIDRLLGQATSCWATGDPARFLPLHSEDALEEIALGASLQEVAEALEPAMALPVTFERIGDVQLEDATHATARVAISVLGEEGDEGFFLSLDFVEVDGEWLMDSFFLQE